MSAVPGAAALAVLERRIRDRIAKLARDRRLTACAHVRTAAVLFACAQHPGAGLHCISCGTEHVERHDPDDELTCDQCGERGDMIHGLAVQMVAVGLPMRDRRGKRGAVWGEIILGGLGVCPGCYQAKAVA